MTADRRRPDPGGGYSMIHALIAVVVLGVGATVAIPRVWAARAAALDGKAVAELNRAAALVEGYRQRHHALPATAADAEFVAADGVTVTMWKLQPVGGVESVHIHARHAGSKHTFHAHYPAEDAITALEWEW